VARPIGLASRANLGLAAAVALAGALCGCRLFGPRGPESDEPLPVKKVEVEIVVAAWAEPPKLPPGGGDTQILVRVQKRGGAPFAGVEVRLRSSTGTLYSKGRILTTDVRGMTRDRLTARRSASITLNAGGTVYRFRIPAGEDEP
jgi:hypothetical protein